MPAGTQLDLDAVGREVDSFEAPWTSRDALLYAVGVGAGQEDPTTELAFTTENTRDVTQAVLPTFAVTLMFRKFPDIGDISLSQILHAEQHVTLHRDLPVEGEAVSRTTVAGMHDKGEHAMVAFETTITAADDGERLATVGATMFVRGAGGWGGERGPSAEWAEPGGEPDAVRTYRTSPGQALVYRLSGDRNPLHSDPAMASAVGFPRPILHGLCTYGYAGRALVDAVCDGAASRFGSMSARLSAPVLPGQELTVQIWRTDGGAVFRTATEAGTVLDHGRFTLR